VSNKIKRLASLIWASGRNVRYLRRFTSAKRGTSLRGLLSGRPVLWALGISPFVCATWSAEDRFQRVIDHASILDTLIPPLAVDPDSFATLVTLRAFGSDVRFVVDQPRWLIREGLLTFSLWSGIDRIFSLTFCFMSENGKLTAIVGGLQGSNDPDSLALFRELTKACSGMRPKDLLIELSKAAFAAFDISAFYATSNANRYTKSAYFSDYGEVPDVILLDYDAAWTDRGGKIAENCLFCISSSPIRRAPEDIPARKRKLYTERYRALDETAATLTHMIRSGAWLNAFEHHHKL
jgi:uncharacterized protein